MKKVLSLFLCVLMLAGGFVLPNSIAPQNSVIVAQAASIKLNKTKKYLVKGQTYKLKVSGTSKKVKWSSSKKSVATVSSSGKVTAKKKGTATITAKVSGKSLKCKVTVETPKINRKSLTLVEGNTFTLKISGTKQKVKWSSNSTNIATVSSKGKVTAKSMGTAKITAKLSCGKKYTCKLNVTVPAYSKNVSVKNYRMKYNRGVVSVLTNKNSVSVNASIQVVFYDKNGNLLDSKTNSTICLEPKKSAALKVSAPYDSNTYEYINFASYKVIVSAEKSVDKYRGTKYISLDINNSPATNKLVVGVTNTGSKDLSYIVISTVFFNENNECIGYDYHYANSTTAGTTDYLNFNYPYDDNYNTIVPDHWKVYINEAYAYVY